MKLSLAFFFLDTQYYSNRYQTESGFQNLNYLDLITWFGVHMVGSLFNGQKYPPQNNVKELKWCNRTKIPLQAKGSFLFMKIFVIRKCCVVWSEKRLNWMATAACVASAFYGITLSTSSKSTTCSMSQSHYPVFTCFASKKNANKLSFMDQILDYIEGTSFSPLFDYLSLARNLQVLSFLFFWIVCLVHLFVISPRC